TSTTALYTLSLHDALPICAPQQLSVLHTRALPPTRTGRVPPKVPPPLMSDKSAAVIIEQRAVALGHGAWLHVLAEQRPGGSAVRSEEHTSELQSRFDLVCR